MLFQIRLIMKGRSYMKKYNGIERESKKMKKQAILLILCLTILIGILPSGLFASNPSLDNFTKINTYVYGQFDDVKSSDWFSPNVANAYELGLMIGTSDTNFNSYGNVTIAEAITMAARIHIIYTAGSEKFVLTSPWYQPYVDYVIKNGIISQGYSDYNKTATRAEFATILAGALPDEALTVVNTVVTGSIPDLDINADYSLKVYKLYRAGILAGNDSYGMFTPDSNIARAAAAAIVTRMANSSLRVKISLNEAVQILYAADGRTRVTLKSEVEAYLKVGWYKEPVIPVKPSSFVIHFIDVGQADAALVICDGKSMLIDGGNVEDSDLIYTYLKKLNITHLDYIVATHAHEDHIGGLSAPLNNQTVGTVYAPRIQLGTRAYENFRKGVQKQNLTTIEPYPGDILSLGSSTITFLAPIKETYNNLDNTSLVNNTSIVLRIIYGDTSFLFMGDAEREAEADIIAADYTLESTVIKIGHHGGETSSSYVFLREVMPKYAIISCGKDNSYGHPTEDVLSRLRDADVKLFRTDMQGDIIATSDGKHVIFTTQKNQNIETNPTTQETTVTPETIKTPETEPEIKEETAKAPSGNYIGNINTHKFHLPSCSYLPDAENRIYFGTRQQAINAGYEACKRCNP